MEGKKVEEGSRQYDSVAVDKEERRTATASPVSILMLIPSSVGRRKSEFGRKRGEEKKRGKRTLSFTNSRGSIVTRRVTHRQQTEEFPVTSLLLNRNTKGTEPASRELLRFLTVMSDDVLVELLQTEDSVGSALRCGELLAVAVGDFRGDALADGVEGRKGLCCPLSVLQNLLSLRVVLEGAHNDFVDRI